jgi:hypothetical protein
VSRPAVLEGLDSGIQVVERQLDSREAPQDFVDLPKQILVFEPRHVERAARHPTLADPPFNSLVGRAHGNKASMSCARGAGRGSRVAVRDSQIQEIE